MGNSLSANTLKGTIGELLVQLRLLEYGIQAAPPIKDSGNDLIAIKGETIKFIQVKTERRLRGIPPIYHIVAIVGLEYSIDGRLLLDKSEIHFLSKGKGIKDIGEENKLTKRLVDTIWE